MKTRSSMADAQKRERAVSGKGSVGAPRTDQPGQAAHGILIIALLLGGFGVVPVAASGYAGGHVNARYQSGHLRHKTMSDLAGSGHIIDSPWMY